MAQDKNQILGAIQDTLNEVQEILAKSGMPMEGMGKAEPEDDGSGMPPPAPEGDMGGAEGAPAPEGDMGGEGAPAPEGDMGAEGGGEDPAAALAEQAKQLSDEELDHMINALMTEKEARSGGEGQGEGAPMPEGEGAAPTPPAGDMAAEKSMKTEFAGLAKSMTIVADAVSKLTKEVSDLKTAKPAAPARVTTKPMATGRQAVQVLEKSAPVRQRLAKSDTLKFLEGEQRKGNKIVTPYVIADVCNADQGQLAQIQDQLELDGLKFPTK